MVYNILINYNTYLEGLSADDLTREIDRLTLSDCVDFFPDYDSYTVRVEYIEDGELVDYEDIIEYTEEDIAALYEEERENELFHEWQELIEW